MKNALFNICLALNCLLLFFILFENRFIVPSWLQVTGRMHPLLVHFPIVLVIIYAIGSFMPVIRKPKSDAIDFTINDTFLLLAAFTSVITALMGLFLSREEGYDPDALLWHKWGGVMLSLFTLAWYYFRNYLPLNKFLPYGFSILAFAIIIFTGHQGANITHGQNFLLSPVMPEKNKPFVSFDEALVFADMVKPILTEKCMSCHNSKKAKGELVMDSDEGLLKGGKTGLLWDSTAADFGLLLQRIHLPMDQKKHMPPHGKPQLNEEELEIISRWIRKGSNFTLKVADLPIEDSLRMIAARFFTGDQAVVYDFEEADPSLVQKLNSSNRVIAKESLNSPALTVSFFNAKLFDIKQVRELDPVKMQVVSLDLNKMPVTDADLKLIAGFPNLRRLHLSFTNITGSTLAELQKLSFLKTLSVSGTKVDGKHLEGIKTFPKLKTVYAWNLPVDTITLQKLRKTVKSVRFETGFKGDTITLKLSPPILQNEEFIFFNALHLKLKHYFPGVEIRITKDSSDPDSTRSELYRPDETLNATTTVRAKAFKPGWISSDIVERRFLKQTYKPDTISLLTATDSNFSGRSALLSDMDKGSTNFRAGNWLAWRRNQMQVLLQYQQPVTIESVTLSSMLDIYRYILPPVNLEVWGGEKIDDLKLLGKIIPTQPMPMHKDSVRKIPARLKTFEFRFPALTVKYIKIVGTPVAKLPKWHPGKGDVGYIFLDEILVN